jgi:putative ABC transport system ATP-binding protein
MLPSGAAEAHTPPRLTVTDLVVERVEAGRPAGRILDRTSLIVEPGAVVAVTGPSGAGKTTLLHAIAGLVKPSAGTVQWGGLDVTALAEAARDRWRRDAVGLVFQDFQLLAELGVIDNILLPARFDRWRTPPALLERASSLATRVGLDGGRQRASVLSRGEQQRVAIARALMRGPQLILADEPTASLDAENGARVADLLIESAGKAGASILVVSHDAALLARARVVYRLDAGRLALVQEGAS